MEMALQSNSEQRVERLIGNSVSGNYYNYPWYFASISTVKTNLSPLEYFKIINSLQYDKTLISAFDLALHCDGHKKEVRKELKNAQMKHRTVLMDSGNYEKYWHRNKEWTKEKFEKTAKSYPCPLTFSYDLHFQGSVSNNSVKRNCNGVLKSQKVLDQTTMLPIVHASKDKLPKICSKVSQILSPITIAVAERELGHGILDRASTVKAIRRSLNESGVYYPLHILGTGHPISLLILTAAGADSFDGLEWCQTTVNHTNGSLLHFQLRELLNCGCPYCKDHSLDYPLATLAHNLHFYTNWMIKLHPIISGEKKLKDYDKYLSKDSRKEISMAIS